MTEKRANNLWSVAVFWAIGLAVLSVPGGVYAAAVAQFSLDATSDGQTFLDITGNGYDAQYNRVVSLTDDDPFALPASKSVSQVVGGGAGTYADVGNISTINLEVDGDTTMTLECWYKPASFDPAGDSVLVQVASSDSGTTIIELGVRDTGRPYSGTYIKSGGGWTILESADTIPLDQWSHLALVNDAGDWRLYVNAVQKDTAWNSRGLPSYLTLCVFGGYSAETNLGLIDDVGIFSHNLQSNELGYNASYTPAPLIRIWTVDATGDWSVGANWDVSEAPGSNTHTAIFGSAITSVRTVVTDSDVTVKAVQFDNANTYVIAGGGSVNLEADSGNASLDVDQGDHEFQARVNLNSNTDADVAAGASLSFNHRLNLGGNTLTKTGGGTLAINNKLTTGGGSVVGVGGTIGGDGAIGGDLTNTSATVSPGNSAGTLTVEGDFSQAAGGTLAIELAGTAGGEFDVLAVTGSASLGGTLEITELYTPGGADSWTILTAVGGITGSFGTITAGYQVALANGDTELVLSLAGALLPGDANGDGCVDDLDLTALAVHWQQATNLWEDGDFNGDGIVDDLDLTALAVNWQQGCGGGGSFADAVAAANVPEPASAVLLLAGFAAIIRRRIRG